MPKISIIVPIYNVEPYLHRCVVSILNQTFTDFECILVDDGSPDKCEEICDEYAKKDKRIRVIHKPNGGLSDARNAGLNIAKGEYIGFVDSDDWIHPQMYEILYKGIVKNDVKLSICAYEEVDTVEKFEPIENISFSKHYGLDFLVEDNITAVVAWNKLYHRSLFKDIRYPVGRIHEDEFTTYKILYKAEKIAFCRDKLYFYFHNPNGITKSEYSLKRLDAVDALEERHLFFKQHQLSKYYRWSVEGLLKVYYWHYVLTGEKEDFRKVHSKLIHKLRKTLIIETQKCHVSIRNYGFYCEVAFPRVVNAYRKLKRIICRKA